MCFGYSYGISFCILLFQGLDASFTATLRCFVVTSVCVGIEFNLNTSSSGIYAMEQDIKTPERVK